MKSIPIIIVIKSAQCEMILFDDKDVDSNVVSMSPHVTFKGFFLNKIFLFQVEEIEGKGSPNENSESLNEGSSSYSGAAKAEESRHTSVSSHSDGPPGHSDSTGKTHDSSRSPSESPAHR